MDHSLWFFDNVRECPATSSNAKSVRPIRNADTFTCDWCQSLDLWFAETDLCFPKLAR